MIDSMAIQQATYRVEKTSLNFRVTVQMLHIVREVIVHCHANLAHDLYMTTPLTCTRLKHVINVTGCWDSKSAKSRENKVGMIA